MPDRSMRRVTAVVGASTLVAAALALAQPPPSDDPGLVPAGHGWICATMPRSSERNVCGRDTHACEQALARFDWGGLPPRCMPHRGAAYCFTYPTHSASLPAYGCYTDMASCLAGRPRVPPNVFPPGGCRPYE